MAYPLRRSRSKSSATKVCEGIFIIRTKEAGKGIFGFGGKQWITWTSSKFKSFRTRVHILKDLFEIYRFNKSSILWLFFSAMGGLGSTQGWRGRVWLILFNGWRLISRALCGVNWFFGRGLVIACPWRLWRWVLRRCWRWLRLRWWRGWRREYQGQ